MGSTESTDVPSTRRRDVEEQVFAFRTLIRRKEYLLHPSDASANPISLDGKLLSNDLLSFTEKASRLRASYFDRYIGIAQDSETHKMCVCVTKEEEEARSFVGNMTKSQIGDLINTLIGSVQDEDLRNGLCIEYSSMNAIRTKRDELVAFHDQVKDILLDQDLCDRDSVLSQVLTEND